MSHKILLFTARGCPQCNIIYPIVRSIAELTHTPIEHVNVDDDKNQHLIDKYNIMSAPSLILISDSGEVYRSVGLKNEDQLRKEIYEAIS